MDVKLAGIPMTKDTAVSLAKAARDVALRRKVPDEERRRRLAICYECPSWTGTRCKDCGCIMRTKAGLKSSTCPQDKW